MSVSGLNHINFHAKRPMLDAMRDFYCDVIGLTEGDRPPFRNFGYWLYAGDSPVVHLWEADPGIERTLGSPATTFSPLRRMARRKSRQSCLSSRSRTA